MSSHEYMSDFYDEENTKTNKRKVKDAPKKGRVSRKTIRAAVKSVISEREQTRTIANIKERKAAIKRAWQYIASNDDEFSSLSDDEANNIITNLKKLYEEL